MPQKDGELIVWGRGGVGGDSTARVKLQNDLVGWVNNEPNFLSWLLINDPISKSA